MDLGIFSSIFSLLLSLFFVLCFTRYFCFEKISHVTTSDTFNTMNRINIIKKTRSKTKYFFFSADSQHREYHDRTNTKVQTNKTAIFRADDIT